MGYRSASAVTGLSGTTPVNVPAPAGVTDGDYVLLVISTVYSATGTAPTVPAGFGAAIWKRNQTAYHNGLYIYGKVAASEGANYSVNEGLNNGTGNGKAFTIAYSGVSSSSPVGSSTSTTPSTQTSVTTITVAALTAAAANDIYVTFCWEYNARTHSLTANGGGTIRGSSSTGALTFAVADENASGAGSISGRTFTDTTAAGDFFSGAIMLTAGGGGSGGGPLTGGLTRSILTRGRLLA